MRRSPSVVSVLSLALAAGALTLAACSDSTTSPRSPSLSPSRSVVAGPGANQLTIASDASTQLCPTGQVNGDYTVPASYSPILSGCVAAPSLMPALAVYNPGWDAPITGSSWIGPTANSSDYRTTPGRFVFQETFTLPAGVTNPTLSLTSMADNVVAVYLNGHLVGTQTVQDCNAAPCNWSVAGQLTVTDNTASDFVIGGTNILTVLLIDTPIGFPLTSGPLGGPAPNFGCARPVQPNGEAGFGTAFNVPTSPAHVVANRQTSISNLGAANQSGCENPTGVDYKGTVSWTVPLGIWCSPGFWKNHPELWTSLEGLLYNTHGPYPNDPQTFVGYDFGKKVGSSNPTLLEVISNPSIYGGPATNNVASYISHVLFGTPLSANPTENCPDVLPFPSN